MLTNVFAVYLILNLLEGIHFVTETKSVDHDRLLVEVGDLYLHDFNYPSKKLLRCFVFAYAAVCLRAKRLV